MHTVMYIESIQMCRNKKDTNKVYKLPLFWNASGNHIKALSSMMLDMNKYY